MTATPTQTAMIRIVMVIRPVQPVATKHVIPVRTSVTALPTAERLRQRRQIAQMASMRTAMQIPIAMTRTVLPILHVYAEQRAILVLMMQTAAIHVIQEREHASNDVFSMQH